MWGDLTGHMTTSIRAHRQNPSTCATYGWVGWTTCQYKDSSSVVTFKAVLQLLESMVVGWFLLENVDLEDSTDPTSNFKMIIRNLETAGAGYFVRAFKIISTDFALPQRRVRLYFCGVSKSKYPEFDMNQVEKVLNLLKLDCQKPATCPTVRFGSALFS